MRNCMGFPRSTRARVLRSIPCSFALTAFAPSALTVRFDLRTGLPEEEVRSNRGTEHGDDDGQIVAR
jgi:hypothetical protein